MSGTEAQQYPSLRNLVHAYFHQDYDLVGNSDDVLQEYRSDTTPSERQELIREIQGFLAQHNTTADELSASFDRIFTPDIRFDIEEDRTLEEALLHIVKLLSD